MFSGVVVGSPLFLAHACQSSSVVTVSAPFWRQNMKCGGVVPARAGSVPYVPNRHFQRFGVSGHHDY